MKKKFSLRNQIFLILIIFIILVLALMYFFQTTLLDTFYKNNKIRSMEAISETITNNLKEDDLETVLNGITLNNDVCIRIVSDSINVMGYSENNVCALGVLTDYQIKRMTSEVASNNNKKLFTNYQFEMLPGTRNNLYVYGQTSSINNEDVLVLVASSIIPLDVTERTIADQFKLIAVIVVIATAILALVISRFIVRPINQIEDESRNLPRGEYDLEKIKTSSQELDSLNKTLGSANEEINKADKAKKELLANVSHDLRTPLTMIAGYGEMIKDIPEENTSENIDVIINEANRLSVLVDDLLDISRWQAGKSTLNKEKTSLNGLLKDVYKQYSTYCKSKRIKFKLDISEDKEVFVDESRIKQVLYNFINNSINYNNKKSKQIILGTEKVNDKTRVYVYDNGNGIGEEDLNNVFDRYYKIDKEHKRASKGSGIGLALCKEILIAHELNYGVESKLEEYSKFYFDI